MYMCNCFSYIQVLWKGKQFLFQMWLRRFITVHLYDIADMLYLFVLQKWLEGIADIDTGFWDRYTKAAKVRKTIAHVHDLMCTLFFFI
jgi:hypothetical protein